MVLAGVLVLAGGGFLAHRLASGSSRAPASVVTATIHVGKSPVGVAVDAASHTAYVTNGNDGTVSVIDTRTNTVTAGLFPTVMVAVTVLVRASITDTVPSPWLVT